MVNLILAGVWLVIGIFCLSLDDERAGKLGWLALVLVCYNLIRWRLARSFSKPRPTPPAPPPRVNAPLREPDPNFNFTEEPPKRLPPNHHFTEEPPKRPPD